MVAIERSQFVERDRVENSTRAGDRGALLIAGIIALAHAPSLAKPLLDSDEAVYASMAALVDAGGRLYAEGGVDNKFPGIYYTYSAVFHVFGCYAMAAVHLLALIVVLATSYVLACIVRRFHTERAAQLAALLYGVLTTFYCPKMLAANTELFMMLPLSLSVLLSLPERGRAARSPALFAAGVLIAIAALYRQLAALNLLLSCSAPLLRHELAWRQRIVRATAPAFGFAIAFVVLLGTYAVQGNLADFVFWTVTVVATKYLPSGWRYAWPWRQLLGMLGVMIVPVSLALLRAWRFRQSTSIEKVIWFWLALGLTAILVLWRFHPHYVIQAVGPLAVLAAIELDQRLRESSPHRRRLLGRSLTALLAVPAIVTAVLTMLLEPINGGLAPAKPDYVHVAEYARETTTPDQRIFVWGAYAALYVLADRLPASRFVGFMRGCPRSATHGLEQCWDSGEHTWPLLAQDLEATRPELILDTAAADYGHFGAYPLRNLPVLREYVAAHYALERAISGVNIYRYRR